MTNKISLRLFRMSPFLLLALVLMACSATPSVSVDDAVVQTIEARDALAAQVQQTVAAELAALQPIAAAPVGGDVPAGGDVADPNANIPVSEPVVDPNLAGGTPQLRVTAGSVNVRTGPGVSFPVFTTLRKDAVVVVVAKNQAGTWFLIELPGGVRGWISNTVTSPVAEADMIKVVIAATIPAPPVAAAPTRVVAAATAAIAPTVAAVAPTVAAVAPTVAVVAPTVAVVAPTAAVVAPTVAVVAPTAAVVAPTAAPTEVPPTATMIVEMPTNTPEPLPTEPTQLTKTSWQVDFLFPGGSNRLQVEFSQNGGSLSGSNRDNNAEVDIVTTGTMNNNDVTVTFTLSNGGSPRGSVTCTGTIDAGPPQTISGSFTAPSDEAVGGSSGTCSFR